MQSTNITRALIAVASLALAAPGFAQGGKMACKECQGAKSTASGKRDACAVPITLTLKGLDCPSCAKSVNKELLAIKGVEECTVSVKDQRAVVWVCPEKNVSHSALKAAVVRAGYEVVKIAKGAPKSAK